jgi:hypothetical protein
MKFIVMPLVVTTRARGYTTQCVLCSEDPRWCDYS